MTLPIAAVFNGLPDPRRETANKLPPPHRHPGHRHLRRHRRGESWEAIAEYRRTKEAFFRQSLHLDNGILSPDTFERLFAKLDPAAFARWMAAACEATRLVPSPSMASRPAGRRGVRPPGA